MLIQRDNFDLIIARKAIHEGKNDTSSIVVDDLIDVGSGVILFGTSSIQIPKIDANPDSTLLFVHGNYIGYPFS